MAGSQSNLGGVGFLLTGPKPPKSLGEFFVRLLIAIVILGVLYFIGMAMLNSFVEGFLP